MGDWQCCGDGTCGQETCCQGGGKTDDTAHACGCGHDHGDVHDHPLHLTAEQIAEINAILWDIEDPEVMDKDLTPEQIDKLRTIFGLTDDAPNA